MCLHSNDWTQDANIISSDRLLKNELIAAHMGMRSHSIWHYWFPAYNPRFSKYSPGLILLLKMAESAASLGLSRIDLGRGDEQYKSRLASGVITVSRGSVHTHSDSSDVHDGTHYLPRHKL